MEGELLIRKVYVDGRFRTEGTNSDFTIDLKQNIECPQKNTVAFLDDVTIPHTWTASRKITDIYISLNAHPAMYTLFVDSTYHKKTTTSIPTRSL